MHTNERSQKSLFNLLYAQYADCMIIYVYFRGSMDAISCISKQEMAS